LELDVGLAEPVATLLTDNIQILNAQEFLASSYGGSLSAEKRSDLLLLSKIFPFRVNSYVLENLIDWEATERDPIFRMLFPDKRMLSSNAFDHLHDVFRDNRRTPLDIENEVLKIRNTMNPHPAGQVQMNLPFLEGRRLSGLQHKYENVVLFFASPGQVCHSYCQFCFRWPQFVDGQHHRFAEREARVLCDYLDLHPEVDEVLFTGGDPLVMSANVLGKFVKPLLARHGDRLKAIRFGTKAIAWWPYRFFADQDSSDLLRLFEDIENSGVRCTLVLHNSHVKELLTSQAALAIQFLRDRGVRLLSQGVILRGVNDTADSWLSLWHEEQKLGIEQYYVFQIRDTGAFQYFRVPLSESYDLIMQAKGRFAGGIIRGKGPVMSTSHGKIEVISKRKTPKGICFRLQFVRARDKGIVGKQFDAEGSESAGWIDDLSPATETDQMYFE